MDREENSVASLLQVGYDRVSESNFINSWNFLLSFTFSAIH